MPGIASATGLISARIRPVRRPKPKSVELSGCTKAAPFVLRPFAGLFNPYPYGCSVLCNHPADCEAKEVVRRAKDTWATEGKALLLPEEMEMIRTSLLAVGAGGNRSEVTGNVGGDAGDSYNTDMIASTVPEELFRKYTETDSRPLTPAPTLASGPTALTNHATQEDLPVTCNPRERTTLVLDLRTNSQNQQVENETFSWHALTLELPPMPRKSEILVCKPVSKPQHLSATPAPPPPSPPSPIAELFHRITVDFGFIHDMIVAGLTPLQYLSKYAYITSGRKLIFGRIFNRFNEEALHSVRRISSSSVEEALQEVIGKALTDEQRSYLKSVIGEITDSLNFREWCGLCAAVERLLCPLPSRTSDPPAWLEKVDFEALERRLKSAESVDTTLALLLKEIRDR